MISLISQLISLIQLAFEINLWPTLISQKLNSTYWNQHWAKVDSNRLILKSTTGTPNVEFNWVEINLCRLLISTCWNQHLRNQHLANVDFNMLKSTSLKSTAGHSWFHLVDFGTHLGAHFGTRSGHFPAIFWEPVWANQPSLKLCFPCVPTHTCSPFGFGTISASVSDPFRYLGSEPDLSPGRGA